MQHNSTTSLTSSSAPSTKEVNSKEVFKNNDQNEDLKKQEIPDDYFTLPPKALLSPTTTRDIYENRLNKPTASSIIQSSLSSAIPVSPPVTTTTVTAQRRRDLKLKAEQQNHEQIELDKASLRQGDEVAL